MPQVRWPTQTPLPDAGAFADLEPGVAYAVLGTSIVLALLFYFGGTIRDRFSKTPPSPPPDVEPRTDGGGPVSAPTPSAAMAREQALADRYIDTLLAYNTAQDADMDELRAVHAQEIARMRAERDRMMHDHAAEVDGLRQEIARLQRQLWQRGGSS